MNQALDDITVDPASFALRDLRGADVWTAFTPSRTGWTDVGTPTITGRFRIVGRQCFFQVKIVPATSVASVAGTSYITLPVTATGLDGDGSMKNGSTLVAIGVCAFDVPNSRVYVPAQTATGNILLIAGQFER